MNDMHRLTAAVVLPRSLEVCKAAASGSRSYLIAMDLTQFELNCSVVQRVSNFH
jgi:hypothetical protein